MINTHYRYENPQVRNAFIFCLYMGLRFCDVKTLTYGNVDYQNKMLNFEQHKTKGHSGLRHTEKYTRAVDELKRDAINSLPDLKF